MQTSEIYNLLFSGGNYSRHYLIKFTHPDLGTLRLVNNNENIVYADETYYAANFDYTPPDSQGDSGQLNITAIDNEDLFTFIDGADSKYAMQVVGILDKDNEVQKLKIYRHFYGSVSMDEDWNISFTLGKDDRLDLKFPAYTYDTYYNPGNA